MDTRTFIPVSKRVALKHQVSSAQWADYASFAFVAIAGDSPRILGAGNDEAALIDQMEADLDSSVTSFFVTQSRCYSKS